MFVWMQPTLGEMMLPVGIYVMVIAVMLWRAAATFVQGDDSGRWATIGAVVFAISDSLLAVSGLSGLLAAQLSCHGGVLGGQLCLAFDAASVEKVKAT